MDVCSVSVMLRQCSPDGPDGLDMRALPQCPLGAERAPERRSTAVALLSASEKHREGAGTGRATRITLMLATAVSPFLCMYGEDKSLAGLRWEVVRVTVPRAAGLPASACLPVA